MSKSIDKSVSVIHTAKKWMSFILLILMTIIVAIAIIGLGIIIIALGGCYWLIKQSYRSGR